MEIALMSLTLFSIALFGAFALAMPEEAAALQAGTTEMSQEAAQNALLANDGRIYPASASGEKLSSTWADHRFNFKAIDKLFVAADTSSIPCTMVVPLSSSSQATMNVRGLTAVADVVFLLDPASGRNACRTIASSAFRSSSSLRSISNLEKTSLVSIGNRAFEKCGSLTGVIELPATCVRIGAQAFYGCGRISEVVLGGSGAKIGDEAFARCSSLATVSLGGVATIGQAAFQRCNGLKKVVIPGSCTSIGDCAFSRCLKLANVKFAANARLKRIGLEAFERTPLKSVTLPDSCAKVGRSAFVKCKSLKKFFAGRGLKSIGERAFEGCAKLSKVVFGYEKAPVKAGSFLFRFTKVARGKVRIGVPGSLLDRYLAKASKSSSSSAWRGCAFAVSG